MISVENLTKEFTLGNGPSIFKSIYFKAHLLSFKALDDLSFHIGSGEVIGIIGPNGAGKSTLLKILSGISQPTSGKVQIEGKSVAILELSTGFNPHLSGRDNIRRRLTLQGYDDEYIKAVEPEIIEFSELSEVIDEKIRTYSLGMAARLAFSIVTAMNAEIFFIDEILAVGDEHFQGKSFSKMREICNSGRTVLIASHSINYVERLCDRAIWLDHGKIMRDGPAHEVCMAYFSQNSKDIDNSLAREYGKIEEVKFYIDKEDFVIKTRINRIIPVPDLHIQIAIHDYQLGILSHLMNSALDGAPPIPTGKGPIWIVTRIRANKGLLKGLIGVVLVRGSGYIPGSIIEDSWGWDNAKQVYFTQHNDGTDSDYVGIPLGWERCT
jgi:ABC-type polysaccharide/polyol phosphate transport system ATPase subunit